MSCANRPAATNAAVQGDLPGLVEMLAHDAEFVGDGGDSGRGVTKVVHGAEPVAMLVRGFARVMGSADVRLEPVDVGTQPGVLLLDADDRLVGVWSLVVEAGEVAAVHGMVNPEKLRHLGLPLNDVRRRGGATPREGTS